MGKMGPMSRMRNGNNNKSNNSNNKNSIPKNTEVQDNTNNKSVKVENIQENEKKACTMATENSTSTKTNNKKFGAYSALVSSHDRVRKNASKKTSQLVSDDNNKAKIASQKNPKSTKKEQRLVVKKANEEFNCINLKRQKEDKSKEIDVRDKKRLEEIIMKGISKKYEEEGFDLFDNLNEDSIMEKIDKISSNKDIRLNKDDLMNIINKKLDKNKIMGSIKITTDDIKKELDNEANDMFEPDTDDITEPEIDDTHEPNVKETAIKENDDTDSEYKEEKN
jgi:hypothetical protein